MLATDAALGQSRHRTPAEAAFADRPDVGGIYVMTVGHRHVLPPTEREWSWTSATHFPSLKRHDHGQIIPLGMQRKPSDNNLEALDVLARNSVD